MFIELSILFESSVPPDNNNSEAYVKAREFERAQGTII